MTQAYTYWVFPEREQHEDQHNLEKEVKQKSFEIVAFTIFWPKMNSNDCSYTWEV